MQAAGLGGTEFPARYIANYALDCSVMPLGVPTGFLRAPTSNGVAFVIQSFIDELAHAAGKDPVQFRYTLLANFKLTRRWRRPVRRARRPRAVVARAVDRSSTHERMRGVLELVARSRDGASTRLPKGTGMGVAFHFSHRGYFAEVVQATVSQAGELKIDKVWVAGDIGNQIINPMNAENQVAGLRTRRHRRGADAGDHDREGKGGAGQLPQLPAAAPGAGAAGRSALEAVGHRAHGPWRAGVAAGDPGAHERDLCRLPASAYDRCRCRSTI